MTGLEKALAEVTDLLNEIGVPYMVIGGLALAQWEVARATLDVDVSVWAEDEHLSATVAAVSRRLTPIPSDPAAFVRRLRVLPCQTRDGIRVDIVFAGLQAEREAIGRAVERPFHGRKIRVVSLEDLLFMKLISERERDLDDAKKLLEQHGDRHDRRWLEPRLAEMAALLDRPEILQVYERLTGGGQAHTRL